MCSEGKPIVDEKSCKEACKSLDLPQDGMQCDDLGYGCKCYKDHNGTCYLHGSLEAFINEKDLIGIGASMICKLEICKNMQAIF